MIQRAFKRFSDSARAERKRIFRDSFRFDPGMKVLDLGSEDGSNIASIIEGLPMKPSNVSIADIDSKAVQKGKERYGFEPIVIKDEGTLPFEDNCFDLVYCSSVIEHVTLPKSEIWRVSSGKEFDERASEAQRAFAAEIARVGRQYFVQTPHRSFPIESHTWLPLAGSIPRELFVPMLSMTNRFWPKKSVPDFRLLDTEQMQNLFPEARIAIERKFGLAKSIMAIRSDGGVIGEKTGKG